MSWALDAIEREATARAERRYLLTPQYILVAGCSVDQILKLISYYEENTGKDARKI